jgi:signal transduction histidine kinase/FixJ family two-component response regulator
MSQPIETVLVVDDDPTNLELVERRLEVEGFATTLVETGRDGLNHAIAEPFAAMLLDLRLPDMNGLDVLAEVRRARPDLPVLIMTAHGSEAIAVKALTEGAAAYLIKPISRRDLVEALRGAIDRSRRRAESDAAQGTMRSALVAMAENIEAEERERAHLEDLLDALDEGVLLVGPNGAIEGINRAARMLFRVTGPIATMVDVLKDVAEVCDEAGSPIGAQVLRDVTPVTDTELLLRWSSGEEQAVSVTTKAFPPGGPATRWVVLLRDVTARRARRLKLEALLAQQAEELSRIQALREQEVALAAESIERVKSSIITTLSHELRTPLNFIVGFGSVLADGVAGELAPEQHALVQKMLNGAERLIGVVEDLLDYAMVDAGMLEAIMEPLDARAVAQEVVALAAPIAQDAGLTLRLEAPGPVRARADAGFVRKVIRQLVGNAIKFTQPGGEVIVRVGHDDAHGGAPIITVSDTGMGVPADELPRLFERFYQVESHATRRFGGTGMGLALAKGLADAMDACLDAESHPGKGSTFRLVLKAPEGT